MKSHFFRPFVATLGLIGLTAGLLAWRGPMQRLAPAGVKMKHDPLLGGVEAQLRTNAVAMPDHLIGYGSEAWDVEPVELANLPLDTGFGRRVYWDDIDRFKAVLSVVVMGTDRASLHRPELCLPSQGVVITQRKTIQLPTKEGGVEILQCYGQAPRRGDSGSVQESAIFAYFFLAADRQTSSHATRQLISMRDLVIRGEMPRWALVTCYARSRPGEEDKEFEKMKRFLTVAIPELRSSKSEAKTRRR